MLAFRVNRQKIRPREELEKAGTLRATSMNLRGLHIPILDPVAPPCVCFERLRMAQSI
jgi:hypothetical protein